VSALPPAEGWWLASDGNWYPPETHPSVRVQTSSSGTHVPGHVPSFQSWLASPNSERATELPAHVTSPTFVNTGASLSSPYSSSDSSGVAPPRLIRFRSRIRKWHLWAGAGAVLLVLVILSPLVLSSSPTVVLPTSRPDRIVSGGTAQSVTNPAVPTSGSGSSLQTDPTTDWLSGHASASQAVAIAKSVASTMWTSRQAALVNDDVNSLGTLETGPALNIDLFHLAMVQCGCQAAYTNSPIAGLTVLVPQQTQYPLDFLAAVQTQDSSTPELMVLTKSSSSSPWLVSFDTESDDQKLPVSSPQAAPIPGQPPGIDAPAPASAGESALQAATDFIGSSASNGGRSPQGTAFVNSFGIVDLASKFASPVSGTSELPVPATYSNVASTTPQDGIWSFAVTGMEPGATGLVCGTVRDTTTTEATTAAPLVQNGLYGPFLPPGSYRTITQVAGMETCVISLANGSLDDFGDNVGGMSSTGTQA